MNLNHQILILAVMITVSFTADAEQVYESVDEKGVIEFSDKPSSADAQVIEVEEPNVADILEESVEPSSSASTTTTTTEASPEPLEVIHQGTADNYDDDDVRERRRENIERIKEHKGEVVQQPVRKGVKSK